MLLEMSRIGDGAGLENPGPYWHLRPQAVEMYFSSCVTPAAGHGGGRQSHGAACAGIPWQLIELEPRSLGSK